MQIRPFSLLAALSLCLIAAGSGMDLDVDLDPGRPYDFIKTPGDTPTGGGRRDAESAQERKPQAPRSGNGGSTVVDEEEEKKKKEPPPAAPFDLPGSRVPNTVDWKQHLAWNPKDDLVEWKDEDTPTEGPGVATGKGKNDGGGAGDPGQDVWDMSEYPPQVPYDLYVYCLTRFLQVQLHGAQVSWMERTQFLIDVGYPAYYASTAVKNEGDLKKMSGPIMGSVGPMIKNPPKKPYTEFEQRVYMDLLLKYPYQAGFGDFIIAQPSGKTLPVLLRILRKERHPFLLRNAVFVSRVFNNREIVEPLAKLLMETRDKVIRNRALISLVRWGPPSVAKWCSTKLNPSDSFSTLAVWAIGRIALVTPIDDGTIKKVLRAAQKLDRFGEFQLSAIPTLGQIGRYADGATKAEIEKVLLKLDRWADTVPNPPSRGGSQGQGMAAKEFPDPAQVRSKILKERIKIALALMKRPGEKKWLDEQGDKCYITNRHMVTEARQLTARD